MANFYKKLFKKIKYHFKGGAYGERMERRDTPALKKMREGYSGFKGSARLGRDIASIIFKRIIGK